MNFRTFKKKKERHSIIKIQLPLVFIMFNYELIDVGLNIFSSTPFNI